MPFLRTRHMFSAADADTPRPLAAYYFAARERLPLALFSCRYFDSATRAILIRRHVYTVADTRCLLRYIAHYDAFMPSRH